MTRINTNVQSLRGLRSLNRSNAQLDSALTRLSTGLKINSGKDDPAGLIAGETLRAQVTAIEASIKNSNRANNVISTADSALGEISGLLNQIRGLVQEGLNRGAISQAEIEANQLQIDAALSAINRISANTSFAGDKLIDGSKAFNVQLSAADAAKLDDYSVNEAAFGSSSTVDVRAQVATVAERGRLIYTGGGLSAPLTLEVGGASGSQVLFFGATSTVDDVRTAVNAVKDVTGVEAEISTAATAGTVTLDTTAANSDVTFTDARATQGTGVFSQTVRVAYVDPGANGSPLGVSIATDASGNKTINISLATNGTGAITTTADQLIAAVAGNAEAAALVTAARAAGSDGSGVVNAVAAGAATQVADGTDGEVTLSSTKFGSSEFVDINVLAGTFVTQDAAGNTTSRDAGTDIGVTLNGITAQGRGLRASVKTASLDVSLSFGEGANTVGQTALLTITGGGSLFQIGQEASSAGQIGIGIEAVNTSRLGGVSGKLYELSSGGGKSLLDVGPNLQGSELVTIVQEALDRVNALRGRLGALQKNVIETNITTLQVALENISESRSAIMDADFAVETANLTKGQILSQAGISVLSIANQNPQQVLSLLGGR